MITLLQPQIAIVGSRKPHLHGRQVAYDFAFYLSEQGFYINSGLAHGIDASSTSGCLTTSANDSSDGAQALNQTYPAATSNHYVSKSLNMEVPSSLRFLPFTSPLTTPFSTAKPKIVSGLSLGVIVAEAALKSGSLLTAQWQRNKVRPYSPFRDIFTASIIRAATN